MLSYHHATTAFFKKSSDTWNFFHSHKVQAQHIRQYKLDLLKNTYKFDEASDEMGLYSKISIVKEKLGLTLPVTIYQAQDVAEKNASIIHLDGHAHIVFSGQFIQSFADDELLAVLAHELSHIHLYNYADGDAEVADRIITAIANHSTSTAAHFETARLFKLYTEIFCDRGSYKVTGSPLPIVTALVKLSTGLQTVNGESYVQQAEEIFASDEGTKTAGISHPENFIRARAIYLWHTNGEAAEPDIEKMIEGFAGIDELDIHRQQKLEAITSNLIQLLLQPSWMNTPKNFSLAKQYFSQFEKEAINVEELRTKLINLHSSVHDYLSYVLYDFATSDKTLEDVPLGYCFHLANLLNIEKPFAATVKKERKLTDKKTNTLKQQSLAEYQKQAITA
jgi:hypothetical protein